MAFVKLIQKIQQSLDELQAQHEQDVHHLSMQLREAKGGRSSCRSRSSARIPTNSSARTEMTRATSARTEMARVAVHGSTKSSTEVIAQSSSVNGYSPRADEDVHRNAVMSLGTAHKVSEHTRPLSTTCDIEVARSLGDGGNEVARFELKSCWLKLPDAAEAFVQQVDRLLVLSSVSDMKEALKSLMLEKAIRESSARKRSTAFDPLSLVPANLIINPNHSRRVGWDLTGIALLSYDMIYIPILISFQPETHWVTTLMGWITLLFWTGDIGLSLLTGFYKEGVLVMEPKTVIEHYLKGWFWIDMFIVLPDWVMKVMGSFLNFAGLGRVLRMARFIRVLRLLRLLKLKKLFDVLYDLIDSESTFIFFNLAKHLVIVLFMNHLVACGWYLIGRLSKEAGAPKNWLQDVGNTPVWGGSFAWKYLTSLHWSITQFTPASMDIFATNEQERLFSVIVLFWALVALSSIIGSVTASMTALRNLSADENKQLWILRRYFKQENVSKKLSSRIFKYLEFQQVTWHNVVKPSSVHLLVSLSRQFQEELAYELNGPFLSIHPLFDYLQLDESLMDAMKRICDYALNSLPVAQEDVLFAPGEEGIQMSFIKLGSFSYTLLDDAPLDEDLGPKQWVAEAVLWTMWRHRGWLKATTPSEALTLNPGKFTEIIHLHPKPTYLAMHYGVDFVNFMNRQGDNAVTDVIFDAEVWKTTVKASDIYKLTFAHGDAVAPLEGVSFESLSEGTEPGENGDDSNIEDEGACKDLAIDQPGGFQYSI